MLLKLLALSLLLGTAAFGQENSTNGAPSTPGTNTAPLHLQASEAKAHEGAYAVVSGKVAEVNLGKSVVRLNFEKPFPKESFTAVIFSHYTNRFSNLEALEGKQVAVRGKITLYHNRPEIQLRQTNQLEVLAEPAASKP